MRRAFTFPGQGSQSVGMGRALAEAFPVAREVFEEVDEALGDHLSRIMFTGPEDVLTLTQNAQPALMAVSIAALRAIEREGGVRLGVMAEWVAGHSLGEYSALAAAGALPVAETARLLRIRGLAMQKAVPVGTGAMAALLGVELDLALAVAEDAAQGQVCAVANDNAPGQIVISGHREAVDRAIALAKERGGKRAINLPVSAPFHCDLMRPAADAMAEALERTVMAPPAVPLVANVTARPTSDPATIARLLVEQVTARVRWRETIEYLAGQGAEQFVEIGAGKVLSGMAKRIARDATTVSIGEPADVEAFLKTL